MVHSEDVTWDTLESSLHPSLDKSIRNTLVMSVSAFYKWVFYSRVSTLPTLLPTGVTIAFLYLWVINLYTTADKAITITVLAKKKCGRYLAFAMKHLRGITCASWMTDAFNDNCVVQSSQAVLQQRLLTAAARHVCSGDRLSSPGCYIVPIKISPFAALFLNIDGVAACTGAFA